ncbi:c-type cytochrome biogenesis protein CcmI [Paracoccus spongiarum]|uniref:C-type cytochrome biogenesis protein CcmI n=1 Tax=Paracoccus spongiarum TaxID=3064387 RepID=A0ABT9JCI1_9RHOB|nr:c-type cytochrome biogenesis protein CcmI [Paracoccus sp. 2205BS29-5]MDP5307511.1 c-type cytochrome biogenesis protein CcmI [Paracoccus sp. 2205BS29-5]
MFWIICAVLVLAVAAAVLGPVWRARGAAGDSLPAAAYDLRVYRDQLREVDRDLERGVIGAEDAARLRTEIGRKVLEADRRLDDPGTGARGHAGPLAALAMLAALAGAVALYLREGAPGAPDLPLAGRIAAAERAYADRPSQAAAEAAAAADAGTSARQPAPDPDPSYVALVEELRKAMARNPDDPQGLALLATSEMRLGNLAAARDAQQRLVDLRGDEARADELMQLAALMMEAAGGLITPEAEAYLARSLRADPALPQSRYLLGMLQLQNGRPDRAFPIWRRLLEEGPPTAPWIAPIRATIADLAWLAGQPDYTPPEAPAAPALPGPDAEAMAAAEDMTPEERQQMIAGMVERLEARLAENGGTPEEWARLISALAVMGRADHAGKIWAEAQDRFAQSAEALAPIRAAAQAAGLVE